MASLFGSLSGVVVFVHENGVCPEAYNDLSSALFPRWKAGFEQFSFITSSDMIKRKAISRNRPGTYDWLT